MHGCMRLSQVTCSLPHTRYTDSVARHELRPKNQGAVRVSLPAVCEYHLLSVPERGQALLAAARAR